MCDELLKAQNLNASDLDAICLSAGPGSYTGLRIGASFAKALCYANSIPLIAVNTLKAWAYAGKCTSPTFRNYVGAIDARRNDVYLAMYNSEMDTEIEPGFQTLDSEFLTTLGQFEDVLFLGSGAKKIIEQLNGQGISFDESLKLQASFLIPLAMEKYKAGQTEDYVYFEPNYIKAVHTTLNKK